MADRVAGTRHLKLRRRHALAVLAVVALCAVPAGDALAAGKGRPAAPKVTRKTAVHKPPARTSASAALDLDKVAVQRGWAWGQAIRGQLVSVAKDGTLTTVTLQRGVVTSVDGSGIVVTSTDGVAITWRLSGSTAVVIPREARRVRPAEVTTDPTSTPTASPTSGTGRTGAITVGLAVRVWGVGATTPVARLVIADPRPPRRTTPPTSSSTTSSSTTSSSTTSSTTTSSSEDPTSTTEPGDDGTDDGAEAPDDPGADDADDAA